MNRWKQVGIKGDSPIPRHVACCVVSGQFVYYFGGYDFYCRNDFFVYDIINKKWFEISPQEHTPSPRHSNTMEIYEDKIYVFGGIGINGVKYNDMYVFDLENFQWSPVVYSGLNVPLGRWGHASAIYGKFMIICFGWVDADAYFPNDMWFYDFENSTWEKKFCDNADLRIVGRHYHQVGLHDDKLFVFSGFQGRYNIRDIIYLDLLSNTWEKIEATFERRGHTVLKHNSLFYIFGGRGGDDGVQVTNTVQIFDPVDFTIQLLECCGDLPERRQFHSSFFYENKMYVMGGIRKRNIKGLMLLELQRESTKISYDLLALFNNKNDYDVVLECDDQIFYAHRNILLSNSDYFRALFKGGLKESNQERILISDFHLTSFENLLYYLYSGKILHYENIEDLLVKSDMLMLYHLKQICEDILSVQINSENIFHFIELAQQQKASKLLSHCLEYIISPDNEIQLDYLESELQSEIQNLLDKKIIEKILQPLVNPVVPRETQGHVVVIEESSEEEGTSYLEIFTSKPMLALIVLLVGLLLYYLLNLGASLVCNQHISIHYIPIIYMIPLSKNRSVVIWCSTRYRLPRYRETIHNFRINIFQYNSQIIIAVRALSKVCHPPSGFTSYSTDPPNVSY